MLDLEVGEEKREERMFTRGVYVRNKENKKYNKDKEGTLCKGMVTGYGGMEGGFLSQKRSGGGKGVKKKSLNRNLMNTSSWCVYRIRYRKDNLFGDTTVLGSFPPLPMSVTTTAGNAPGKSSYANVTGKPSGKKLNIRTFIWFLLGEAGGIPCSNYVRNTCGKYGLIRSMFSSSTGLLSFQFSSMEGLDAMLENGLWFIQNHPLILKKWHPNENLLKEDISTILVWVKFHGVTVTTFSKDGLSAIATKLVTPLMLDSYTFDMCMQSWGRSSYARVMIELRPDVELKDNIVVAAIIYAHTVSSLSSLMDTAYWMSKHLFSSSMACSSWVLKNEPIAVLRGFSWSDFLHSLLFRMRCPSCKVFGHIHKECSKNTGTCEKKARRKPGQTSRRVPVGPKIGFKPQKEFRHVPKKTTATSSGNKKKGVEPTIEVSNSNPFEVLNLVDNDVELDGNPLKKVEFPGDYDSQDEVASVENDMAYPYDDDMYDGQDLSQKLQAICNNLDIRVRGRKSNNIKKEILLESGHIKKVSKEVTIQQDASLLWHVSKILIRDATTQSLRCPSCKVFGHIHKECSKNTGTCEKKARRKPGQTSRRVPVCPKIGFKPQKEFRHVPKKTTATSSGNKKKGVEPTIEVSNSNPFEVLNSVDNDVELGTNGGTNNLVNNGATLSGSSFMNVNNSSTGTTLVIDKIKKFKDLITSGKVILVDEAGNPLKKVEFPGDYDSQDEVASVENDMACSMTSKRGDFGTQSLLEQ
nr:hypothetical protein [Tanacetum cinerariifolium]